MNVRGMKVTYNPLMPPGPEDQRREPRFRCDAPARAEGPRGPVRGVCKNISVGGMFFSGTSMPVGTSVEWVIDLPNKLGRVRAVGEVRYLQSGEGGPGMGVRFTRLSQEDLERIKRFVATAQPV
jgi:uncharacterized protein (TIGR02266 family)